MADTARPVLSLNTLIERRFIRIGDQHYELRNPGDLTIRQQLWLEVNLQKYWELLSTLVQDSMGDDAEIEMTRIGDRLIELALDAPIEVRNALPVGHKIKVIRAFVSLPNESPETSEAQPQTGEQMLARLTGNGSSPDSSTPTAVTQSPGSTGSLSH